MCDHQRQSLFVLRPTETLPCTNSPQRSGCCTPRLGHNNATTTQTDTCRSHTHSREITRSNSAPAAVCHGCDDYFYSSSSNHHQIFRSTSRIEVLLRELLDLCIEGECSVCTESCTTTRTCSGWQHTDHCNVCESDRQVVVSELMELLERFGGSSRTCESRGVVRWSERDRSQESHGACSGYSSGRGVRYEAQTLFEILLRITRRKTHTSPVRCSDMCRRRCQSRERHNCGGQQWEENDSSLRRLVGQLLDELEGNAGCECQGCSEYLEINLRRMRRELRRNIECSGREVACSGSNVGCVEIDRCSGRCESTVSKTIVYGAAPRRPRTGNVHVGWSLR